MRADVTRVIALAGVCAATLLAAGGPARAGGIADAVELSPRARTPIDRGLAYLAATQRQDGSWPGSFGSTTGIVATCSLSFMAAGHVPGRGKYGANVSKCIQFLISDQACPSSMPAVSLTDAISAGITRGKSRIGSSTSRERACTVIAETKVPTPEKPTVPSRITGSKRSRKRRLNKAKQSGRITACASEIKSRLLNILPT